MAFHRVLVVGLILAVLGLLAWRFRRRQAGGYAPPVSVLDPEELPGEARGRLAVLGFRSRFCAACRETPDIVARALAPMEGEDVAFVPVDVADHPDLVHHLDVPSTPTVVLVDARGRVRFAHEGNPDPEVLRVFLEEARLSLQGSAGRRGPFLPRLGGLLDGDDDEGG